MIRVGDQIKTERHVLLVYCFYCILLTVVTVNEGWPMWLAIIMDMSWTIGLVMQAAKFRDYQFRACFTAGLMQINLVMWSVCVASLTTTMPVLAALTVALGLYGIPEMIYISVASATFLNVYHILIAHSIDLSSESAAARTVMEVISVYFISYAVYNLNKKQLQNSRRQRDVIASLQAAERSKDDFLANISHEIRTPINTICGMSEIVLREELPGPVRADVHSIQTAGRSLLSIVSDVLDFSELQSGKMSLVMEDYNITSTMNDIINMTMARRSSSKIELIVDCDAGLPCGLYGDEQKIRRVIMNLADNALKFTSEGGVCIAVSSRRTDYGINLIVCVKDTGIGLNEESQEKLFTSFNQADTRRSRQESGIGLGLAISQAMVDKMGGFIMVSSKYGRGSQFQVVIPQKVTDDTPIAAVREPERLHVAVYIDMEQFGRVEIRDEYGRVIRHLISQLNVKSHFCQNLAELKQRAGREIYTHIFASIAEYEEDRDFFDQMSEAARVVLIIDREDDARISNPKILRLYKPLYVLPVVMMLNEEKIIQDAGENERLRSRFIAPDTHVLAVDDNRLNLRVLEGLLGPYQIKVSTALSGAEALEKIETMNYDFIFMDHMMPEMDGIETMHRIRQKQGSYFKQIPIIALTANAIGGMREVFLAEGFQDFMAKPIELSVLERVLRRNLPQEKIRHIQAGEPGQAEAGLEEACGEPGQAEAGPEEACGVLGQAGRAAQEACGESGQAGRAAQEACGVLGQAEAGPEEACGEPGQAEAGPEEAWGEPGQAGRAAQEAWGEPGQAEAGPEEACGVLGQVQREPGAAGARSVQKAADSLRQDAAGSVPKQATRHTDLPEDRFDEQMGINYCGGVENYIEVLQLTSRGGQENKDIIQKCYEAQDWKNYTIYVHALKSSMLNIGAVRLSAMAKELEQAGKQHDAAYIFSHHAAMMAEYAAMLQAMSKSRTIYPAPKEVESGHNLMQSVQDKDTGIGSEDKKEDTKIEELEASQLEHYIREFEDAAYALDEETMAKIAGELMQRSWRGRPLKEVMEIVMRKISMSDYMSANEVILRLKD